MYEKNLEPLLKKNRKLLKLFTFILCKRSAYAIELIRGILTDFSILK